MAERIISDFPHDIEETEDMGIVLPDGCRLSARVWMPDGASAAPVPAILEYLPYRKRDGTVARDIQMHPWFAGHGYACLRVDRRGCGDSEGLFDDEYSEQELRDGVDVINWIAAQPWCSGKVGIMGISWGGFNGLQIAALQPEPLAAVISICSSVDRFADDIHYKGGVQLGENIGWVATATSWLSMPPDPAIVGARWREIWLERLNAFPDLAEIWTGHKDRDSYWKHGSICEDYSAIHTPVLTIGGWHDGYRNTISHLVENLSCPVKGIVGPWNHKYPHIAAPEPRIGFLQEALRWWDHWLKGLDTGVDSDPAYRAYLMDSVMPEVNFDCRPGHWIAEPAWPAQGISGRQYVLTETGLGDEGKQVFERPVTLALACGQACGEYFPFGFGPGELPDDQRPDDALSTCFDSPPLDESLDIVGAPVVRLTLRSDQPKAQIVVRLCDLRPDGTSALLSYQFQNLRHRDGSERARDLTPGESFEVALTLDQMACRLPAGHRLRVAVSCSYWPFIWPEAVPFCLSLSDGVLDLPLRPRSAAAEWEFPEPEMAPAWNIAVRKERGEVKILQTDVATGEIQIRIEGDNGVVEDIDNGLVISSALTETWTVLKSDPASARADICWKRSLGRGDWRVSTNVQVTMQGDETHFHTRTKIVAHEGENEVLRRDMKSKILRY